MCSLGESPNRDRYFQVFRYGHFFSSVSADTSAEIDPRTFGGDYLNEELSVPISDLKDLFPTGQERPDTHPGAFRQE